MLQETSNLIDTFHCVREDDLRKVLILIILIIILHELRQSLRVQLGVHPLDVHDGPLTPLQTLLIADLDLVHTVQVLGTAERHLQVVPDNSSLLSEDSSFILLTSGCTILQAKNVGSPLVANVTSLP